jgi:hypothetical protein
MIDDRLLDSICRTHGLSLDAIRAKVLSDLSTSERAAIENISASSEVIQYLVTMVLYLEHDLLLLDHKINAAVEILSAE